MPFSFSYYVQHFADTFRQSVIDLLLGNLEDLSEISADDPWEQIGNIAQTALIPESSAPQYFDYGVLGNDLKFLEDTVVFARFIFNLRWICSRTVNDNIHFSILLQLLLGSV